MTRLRVLSSAEAADNCCFANECDADPSFEVATDRGPVVACDSHVEELVPPEERAPVGDPPASTAPSVTDIREVFRAQDALKRVDDELVLRAFGAAPDQRFDPILDSLLDLVDALDAPARRV